MRNVYSSAVSCIILCRDFVFSSVIIKRVQPNCNFYLLISMFVHFGIAKLGTVELEYTRDLQLCEGCPADAVPCADWPSRSAREWWRSNTCVHRNSAST